MGIISSSLGPRRISRCERWAVSVKSTVQKLLSQRDGWNMFEHEVYNGTVETVSIVEPLSFSLWHHLILSFWENQRGVTVASLQFCRYSEVARLLNSLLQYVEATWHTWHTWDWASKLISDEAAECDLWARTSRFRGGVPMDLQSTWIDSHRQVNLTAVRKILKKPLGCTSVDWDFCTSSPVAVLSSSFWWKLAVASWSLLLLQQGRGSSESNTVIFRANPSKLPEHFGTVLEADGYGSSRYTGEHTDHSKTRHFA